VSGKRRIGKRTHRTHGGRVAGELPQQRLVRHVEHLYYF
jgi:hypothetical protein